MPSKTPKQARAMRAACHDSAIAKRLGIPKKVACEFVNADERRKQSTKRRQKGS